MTRNLKALGLALFAAFALGAVMASTAAAVNTTHHITASVPWTPTASAIGVQEFRPTTERPRPNTKCNKVSATTTELVPATTDNITVTPAYTECTAENEAGTVVSAFVEQEGCDYQFLAKTTPGNPTGGEHASILIKNHLEPTKTCEIKTKVTAFKLKCLAIPNQEIKDAVRYEQGEGDIVLHITAHGFESTTENSTACPTSSGGTEVHTDGTYKGDVTLKAHNSLEQSVPLTLTSLATP